MDKLIKTAESRNRVPDRFREDERNTNLEFQLADSKFLGEKDLLYVISPITLDCLMPSLPNAPSLFEQIPRWLWASPGAERV